MRVYLPLLVLALAGCDGGEEELTPCGESGGGFVDDYDSNAAFETLMAAPFDAGSVHGEMQIWYSTDLTDLIDAGGSFTAPVGATAIKNVRGEALAIMVKEAAGFDADNGDWCYEFRDIDGTLNSAGTNTFCSDCHNAFTDFDALGGTDIR